MFSFLLIILLIPLIILSFWFPLVCSSIILVLYFLIELMAIAPTLIKTKPIAELNLNEEESKIFTKYYAFFRYNFGSQDISRMLAIIQISALILAPLLWFKGLTIQAVIFAVNYFVVGPFAVKLNPAHYLGEEIKKGNLAHIKEYELLKSVSDKINNFQDKEFKRKYPEKSV